MKPVTAWRLVFVLGFLFWVVLFGCVKAFAEIEPPQIALLCVNHADNSQWIANLADFEEGRSLMAMPVERGSDNIYTAALTFKKGMYISHKLDGNVFKGEFADSVAVWFKESTTFVEFSSGNHSLAYLECTQRD